MKLTPDLLRSMVVGESVLITETRTNQGQGDVSYLFSRLRPRKFSQKRLLLVNPETLETKRVWEITRKE